MTDGIHAMEEHRVAYLIEQAINKFKAGETLDPREEKIIQMAREMAPEILEGK